MLLIEHLSPTDYRRTPWKNGRGELVVIANEGGQNWQDMGVAWHFGRTAIVEEGPFSDYTHYERLQVVIRGAGLVLIAPDHEIDLRRPMLPRRYDGGLPIRTRLEKGPVEVVNLIAHRARFDINLNVVDAGAVVTGNAGRHVVYAAVDTARVEIDGLVHSLAVDHALKLLNDRTTKIAVTSGHVLIGSICNRR
jgi:uncharacterized protein